MSDMKDQQFHAIDVPEEREAALLQLVKEGRVLRGESMGGATWELIPTSFDASHIRTEAAAGVSVPEGSATAHFQIGHDLYFISVSVQRGPDRSYLLIPEGPLFLLQRREAFRMILPTQFNGRMELRTSGGSVLQVAVFDLSVSGCGVDLDSDEAPIQRGQSIEGLLQVADLKLAFKGRVVSSRPHSSHVQARWRAGIQFDRLSVSDERAILRVLMAIYRSSSVGHR